MSPYDADKILKTNNNKRQSSMGLIEVATKKLQRRFAVIAPNIQVCDKAKKCVTEFAPSAFHVSANDSVRQSVHFVYRDGFIRYNVLCPTFTPMSNTQHGPKVMDKLTPEVSIVAVLIKSREKRELILYPLDRNESKVVKNFMP